MSRPSLVLIALLVLAGCVTRSAEQSSPAASRSGATSSDPEYAWDMAVCDAPQPNGHCDMRDGASQGEVDIADSAFYVTVRSIGRGEAPLSVRLYKQRRNTFDGSAVGTPGRRVSASPAYQFGADNVRITHKFEFSDGVLHNGMSYVVVATSGDEELYATVTTTGAKELQDGEGGMDVPTDEAPSEL